jgi:hypothetical protein
LASAIRTGRGVYLLDLVGDVEMAADAFILPLKLEHQGGIERIVFRCRIARALLDGHLPEQPAVLVERLAPWIEREFEQVREQALKSIRSDKRLFELGIDQGRPGPF